MRTWTLALILLSILGTGCDRQTTIREVQLAAPTPQNQMAPEGAVDGGGANGVNGLILESYHVDIFEREEVKNTIKPLIDGVARINPRFAAAMYHILTNRNWYMIPVPLKSLPAKSIGVFFDSEQMALQSHKEIWIDSRKFDKISEKDRTKVLLHEILMGVRIYRFTEELDHCLVFATEKLFTESNAAFTKATKSCMIAAAKRNPVLRGGNYNDTILNSFKKLDIKETDYPLIRNLTVRLLKGVRNARALDLSSEELDIWLIDAGLMTSAEVSPETEPAQVADPQEVAPE